jgi:hypothetical protein
MQLGLQPPRVVVSDARQVLLGRNEPAGTLVIFMPTSRRRGPTEPPEMWCD